MWCMMKDELERAFSEHAARKKFDLLIGIANERGLSEVRKLRIRDDAEAVNG